MKRLLPLIPVVLILLLWQFGSAKAGGVLLPSPGSTLQALGRLLCEVQTWQDAFATLWRGFLGLLLAGIAAYLTGIFCGLHESWMKMFSPLVAFFQSCPPIVWISLLLVWAGVGAITPIFVVFSSTFPVLFINLAQGTAAIDRRYFEMARLYHVPRHIQCTRLILPALATPARSAFAYALGITWKVAATAEYLGSEKGLGARIQLSFQKLDMPSLFAWTLILAVLGLVLDRLLPKA